VALLRAFREALAALGVGGDLLAVDLSARSAAFQLADRRFLVPRIDSPEFVPTMLALCQREGVRLIIPTLDPELPVYAAHRQAFADIGCTVAVSSPAAVAIGSDKLATHAWLLAQGFPTVRQASAVEFLAAAEGWTFPVIAKPVAGSASIGVLLAHSADEVAAVAATRPYIVQSVAPGVEFTVSVLADRAGRAVCAVPRQRLEVRAGEVSKALAVRNPAVQKLAMDVIERLPGAYGALNVQLFWDAASGAMHVIEINPRFGGGFPLAWRVGARYPQWLLEELLGLPSTATADAWEAGVMMLRYDDAVFVSEAALGDPSGGAP
jgi:carbamoyl-phosphate synthase large subunit